MKIKRFVAESMREALESVRAELGPDAVIISNRRIDGGIELITAVDYDETLIEDALQRLRPAAAPVAPPSAPPAAAAPRRAPAPPAAPRVSEPAEPVRPQVVRAQDDGMLAMRREVESLRSMLQDQLASLAWSDRLRRDPLKGVVLKDLTLLGLAPDIARMLTDLVPAATSKRADTARIAPAVLLKHLPVVEDNVPDMGGVVAVVGPTGAGKTTTIAKIAARWALMHDAREIALVSLDRYRIGARDQLATFARILGIPMHVASDSKELGGVLDGLASRKLVLIDTAGMSPRDPQLAEQFATLAVAGRRVRTLLALPANGEQLALDQIARAYAPARPEALVLTKIDEAASLGPVLSVALRQALPLAWLANGQRVPDDLHAAPKQRTWLIKQALKLAAVSAALHGVDDAYLAAHFGKVATHG